MIILICLVVPESQAQQADCHISLIGEIQDGESNELLDGVVLFLKQAHISTSTNEKGEFDLKNICAGRDTLIIQYTGYKKLSIPLLIKKTMHRDFALHADTCELASVTVTHKRSETSTLQVQELSGKQLQQTRGLSLGESIKTISGVNTLQTGPSIFKPVLQGLYGYRIQIINNGVKLESQQWGDDHAPEVDPYQAEKIKIVKGAASVRYGADAIGGVISLESPKLSTEGGVHGEVNLGAFTNGRIGTAGGRVDAASDKIKGLAIRLQGSGKKGGNYDAPRYYIANTGSHEWNGAITTRYERKTWDVEAYVSTFNTKLGIFSGAHVGNIGDLLAAIENKQPAVISGFSYDISSPYQLVRHHTARLSGTFKKPRFGEFLWNLSYQDNDRKEYSLDRRFSDIAAGIYRPSNTYRLSTTQANLAYNHKPFSRITGTWGTCFSSQQNVSSTTTGFLIVPNYQQLQAGVFITENWKKDKLTIEAGARYDFINRDVFRYVNNFLTTPAATYQNLSGNVGLGYLLTKNLYARFNLGTGFRAPALNELYSRGLNHGQGIYVSGDEKLQPERAFNAVLGLTYQTEKTLVEFSAYNNIIHNYIYLKPVFPPVVTVQGVFPAYNYTATNAMLTGFDMALQQALPAHFTFNSKVSMLRGFNLIANDNLLLMPPPRLELGLQYQVKDIGIFHENTFGINWTGTMEQIWLRKPGEQVQIASGVFIDSNNDYAKPPPGYQLCGAKLSSRLMLGKQPLDMHLAVNNIFNSAYREYLNFYRYFTDEPGRNISLRIHVPF